MTKSSPQNRSFLILLAWLCALFVLLTACAAPATPTADAPQDSMVLIPAGEFEMKIWNEMKNESTTHSIHVDDFYVDKYEVTNQRYAQCVEEGTCLPPLNDREYGNEAYSDHPVTFITWDMASTYCAWRDARLPTIAEWEKAAQDELEEVEYYWGEESPVCQRGARLGRSVDPGIDLDPETRPVGATTPNTFGLYEMTGGMWEWVQDPNELDIYDNPPDVVSFLRMSRWSGYGPIYQRFFCGFRCARSPGGE